MKVNGKSKGQGTEPTISSRERRLRRVLLHFGYRLHKSRRDGLYQIIDFRKNCLVAEAPGLTLEGAEEWALLRRLDAGPNTPTGGFRFTRDEAITFVNYLKRDLADTERWLQKPKLTKAEAAKLNKGREVTKNLIASLTKQLEG
ncbi:MAG TPA: hypothetical protein VMS75_01815 [Terriglobales bacterium]|nr:hypothetical protein [Terriglobales bacterium]